MPLHFGFSPEGEPIEAHWNVFFMALSLVMAVIGSFTAIQFVETLMAVEKDPQTHTSKRGSAFFSVFAASWCLSVNCVWVMHFLAMSAVSHGEKAIRYNVFVTLSSMFYIFLGAFLALVILTFHKNSVIYKTRKRKESAKTKALQATEHSDRDDLTGALTALRIELALLLGDLWEFLSIRLLVSSILLGSGVVLMHFSGMDAMRLEGAMFTLHPYLALITFPIAWVGSAVILFFLFHMHGFKRRIAAALIIGVAVNGVHYYGYFAGTFRKVELFEEPRFVGQLLMDAEFASVIVALLSSVARFIFMGMIAASV